MERERFFLRTTARGRSRVMLKALRERRRNLLIRRRPSLLLHFQVAVARRGAGKRPDTGTRTALGFAPRGTVFRRRSSFEPGRLQTLPPLGGSFALSHHTRGLEVPSLARFSEDARLLYQLIELLQCILETPAGANGNFCQ